MIAARAGRIFKPEGWTGGRSVGRSTEPLTRRGNRVGEIEHWLDRPLGLFRASGLLECLGAGFWGLLLEEIGRFASFGVGVRVALMIGE